MVAELLRAGPTPRIDILAHGLRDEETAFRVEAAVIDALGLERLLNRVRGWRSIELGRMPLRQLVVYYDAEPVRVRHPAVLIRINQRYQHGMSDTALYEATRGVWRLSDERAKGARYALAIFEGVVREVYEIQAWHRAGSTKYETRGKDDLVDPERIEFTGSVAAGAIRGVYLDRSVEAYFRRGAQSPVVYVNC